MKIIRTNARVESGGTVHTDILYADLLALISNNELIPNSSYRITDYTTTTAQTDTISAGHNFDIIVTALSVNELSEDAKCVKKESDTYFANADLEAWEIKYCIDNDTTRFAWADTANGKGVIYYMKDEWNNECPYDFKNIQFKRYPILSMPNGSTALVFNANTQKTKYALKDADGDIVPIGAVIDENNASYYFTFNAILQASATYDIYDASIIQKGIKNSESGDFIVQNNKVNEAHTTFDYPYKYGQILKLNNIVINNIVNSLVYTSLSEGCHSNTFDNDCYYITFGNDCYSNTFSIKCDSNTFGNGCYYNTFSNGFDSNTFGNNCDSNTFGDKCDSNTFGNNCYSNTFGIGCDSNTFGDNCTNNTFGNGCSSNTFGNDCKYNTFGINCNSNTFSTNCYGNTFGINCNSNTFSTNCNYNTFGDSCYSNTFNGNFCNSNTFGDSCYSNTFAMLCRDITFGNRCYSNTFGSTCNNTTFGSTCHSNTFGNNCYSTIFSNNCHSNTFGNNCYKNTFGTGCDNNTFGVGCISNTFGTDCSFNNFYHGTTGNTKKDYIRNLVLEDTCRNNNFYSSATTSSTTYLYRIRISGCQNDTPTSIQILSNSTNSRAEWVICYTSGNVLKQYYPND